MHLRVTGNELEFNGRKFRCAIGKNGFSSNKKEGDNCTPLGTYPIREIFYRADKISAPQTKLPLSSINQDDGWSDAPDSKEYNTKVKLPYPSSHEKLWRDDDLYDIVVVLGYNDSPPVAGKGSAIFMHIARPGYLGTEGCVALAKEDLLEVLKHLDEDSLIHISTS